VGWLLFIGTLGGVLMAFLVRRSSSGAREAFITQQVKPLPE
jgi:hypothetical protein